MSTPPEDMDLVDVTFMKNPLVLIAATGSPLAKRKALELADLNAERFILREKGSGTRMAVDNYFKRVKFRPTLRLELGSNEAIKESVAGGLGISVISSHALHGRAHEHGVSVLNVQGFPIESNWHLVHPRGKRLSPIASVFKSHLLGSTQTTEP